MPRSKPELTDSLTGTWLRLWVDVLDSPKIHELDVDLFAGWVKLLLVAKKFRQNGKLPGGKLAAFWSHQDGATVARWYRDLEARGFLERDADSQLWIHDWRHWQSPTNAERQRRYRDRLRSPSALPLETKTETKTERGDTERNARYAPTVTRVTVERNAPIPDPPQNSPPVSWDSRQQEVMELARERWGASNGDYFVGDLLKTHTADLVMEAIDRHWNKVGPAIRPPLLAATCRGMQADGWTPVTGKPAPEKSRAKTYGNHPGP